MYLGNLFLKRDNDLNWYVHLIYLSAVLWDGGISYYVFLSFVYYTAPAQNSKYE